MSVPFFDWISTYGEVVLALLLMVGVFGLPVPDETLLTFAGVLVRQGKLHFASTWVAAAFGSICGITLSYALGRGLGPSAVTHFGRWFRIDVNHLRRVEAWFERSGKWMLTFGYFVPGVRHLTAIVAGSARLPVRLFASYAYAGAVLWSLTFITFGWTVGLQWEAALHALHRHILTVIIVVATVIAAYLAMKKIRTRKDRR